MTLGLFMEKAVKDELEFWDYCAFLITVGGGGAVLLFLCGVSPQCSLTGFLVREDLALIGLIAAGFLYFMLHEWLHG